VNQLRQLMLEELRRRNFADTTIRCYLHGVAHFSRYFRRPPDQLGPEDIRKYQAMLFTKLKYSPNTVILRLASLRFFYIHVLKRGWSIAETPYPKKVRHLPEVLSQEEVARLIDAADSQFHRVLLMTLYATGARPRGSSPPKGERHRQPAHGGSYPGGQGRQGPRRDAQPEAA
jgi:integrase/recombinase XerD